MAFSLALLFFLDRGPYRAIRFSTTGDFSTVYAAARCWIHGTNPYDRASLKAELVSAGAPPDLQRDQDINPSVYLPAALPWTSALAWLRWEKANLLWCLLSVAMFGWSLWKILAVVQVSAPVKWLLAAAALLFSPTYVGVYDGNPSVINISLITLAVCLAIGGSEIASGLLFGIALCFKPQLAVCALAVFLLWKRWKIILIGLLLFALASGAGVLFLSRFGRDWSWWQTEQHNVAISFEPGGQSDPGPQSRIAWQLLNAQTLFSYLPGNARATNIAVWSLTALLAAAFLFLRKKNGSPSPWTDIAFFSVAALAATYHRYYDAQLLLLLIPLWVQLWQTQRRFSAWLLTACLALLAFPLQSIFARRLAEAATVASFRQFVLLRSQPLAILAMAIVLAFCYRLPREAPR